MSSFSLFTSSHAIPLAPPYHLNTVLGLTVFLPVAWGGSRLGVIDDGIDSDGFLAPGSLASVVEESAMGSHPFDLRSERWEIVHKRNCLSHTATTVGWERNGGGNWLCWWRSFGGVCHSGGGDD